MISRNIKKYLPNLVLIKLRYLKNNLELARIFYYDFKRFRRVMNYEDKDKLEYNLLINTHIIEKGLSHNHIKFNFGKVPLQRLVEQMNEYRKYTDYNNEIYQNALSTLKEYYRIHKENNQSTEYLEKKAGLELIDEIKNSKSNFGGSFSENNTHSLDTGDFKKIAFSRHTIREFDHNKPLDYSKVNEAISIASKSPSACNRQSAQVLIIRNKKTIEKLLKVQGGFRGYDIPDCLLITVDDLAAYSSASDRNMGYVDGGLFTMSLLYALEYENIGACTLNTSFSLKKENDVRKVLNLDSGFGFITFIAVGNKREINKIAKSHRLPTDHFMKVLS